MADDEIIALGDTEQADAYENLAGTIKSKFQALIVIIEESMVMIWHLQKVKNQKYLLK